MNPPVQRLVVRVGQLDAPSDVPPVEGTALYRLVDGQMAVCARHLSELGAYREGLEARVVLTAGQIESLVVEFGLRRDDLTSLHGPRDPILVEERCQMCEAPRVEGNLCHSHDCSEPLHPQWPAVYCSNACAREDAW